MTMTKLSETQHFVFKSYRFGIHWNRRSNVVHVPRFNITLDIGEETMWVHGKPSHTGYRGETDTTSCHRVSSIWIPRSRYTFQNMSATSSKLKESLESSIFHKNHLLNYVNCSVTSQLLNTPGSEPHPGTTVNSTDGLSYHLILTSTKLMANYWQTHTTFGQVLILSWWISCK